MSVWPAAMKEAWLRQLGRIPTLVDGARWSAAVAEFKDVRTGWTEHPNWGVEDQPSFPNQAKVLEALINGERAANNHNAKSAKAWGSNALTWLKAEPVVDPTPEEPPVEEPEPPPPPPQHDPDIFWGRTLKDYTGSGSEPPLYQPRDSHIKEITLRDGEPGLEFITDETASKVTENPRCEALSKNIRPGTEYWRGGAFEFDHLAEVNGAFENIWQTFAYPWNGSPAISAKVEGAYLIWMKNVFGGRFLAKIPGVRRLASAWQTVWKIPVSTLRNRKVTYLEHVVLPTRQEPSLYEVWVDGNLMFSGKVSIYDSSTASGNFHVYIQNYHKKGLPRTIIKHWPMRVASTRAAAEYPH